MVYKFLSLQKVVIDLLAFMYWDQSVITEIVQSIVQTSKKLRIGLGSGLGIRYHNRITI